MTAMPTSIVVAGHTFDVRVVTDPTEGLHRQSDRHKIGITDVEAGRIVVRGGIEQSVHNVRDTLLHEVIHAVLSLTSLDGQTDVFKTDRMSERVVEVLTIHLLDTMRRNPELVAYLTETEA